MIPGPTPDTGIASPVVCTAGSGVAVASGQLQEDSDAQLAFRHRFTPFTDEQVSPDAQLLSLSHDASQEPEFDDVSVVGVGVAAVVGVAVGLDELDFSASPMAAHASFAQLKSKQYTPQLPTYRPQSPPQLVALHEAPFSFASRDKSLFFTYPQFCPYLVNVPSFETAVPALVDVQDLAFASIQLQHCALVLIVPLCERQVVWSQMPGPHFPEQPLSACVFALPLKWHGYISPA